MSTGPKPLLIIIEIGSGYKEGSNYNLKLIIRKIIGLSPPLPLKINVNPNSVGITHKEGGD